MTFWFSGELDYSIGEEYRQARLRVEPRLNARCGDRNYGDAITKISIIPMILGPRFLPRHRERRLWQRKQRSADYRTIIDYESFKRATDIERQRLLLENTLDAIRDLQRKAGARFHGKALISDILTEFPEFPELQAA